MNGMINHTRMLADNARKSMDAWLRALLIRHGGDRFRGLTDGAMASLALARGFMIEHQGDNYTLSQNGKVLGVFAVKTTYERDGNHVKGIFRISESTGKDN